MLCPKTSESSATHKSKAMRSTSECSLPTEDGLPTFQHNQQIEALTANETEVVSCVARPIPEDIMGIENL